MSSAGRIFLLLMWKNFHLRKHRWFMTLTEIFLPILVVYFLCKNTDIFIGSEAKWKNATKPPAKTISNIYSTAEYLHLAYTPSSSFTDELMRQVNRDLKHSLVESVADETKLESLLLKKYNQSISEPWMGIVFQNVVDDRLSSKDFVYKIRSCEKWFTNRLYPKDATQGPRTDDPYFYKGFAALQLSINLAYLQSRQLYDEYEVKFQPFPYPEYRKENMMRATIPIIVSFVVIITSTILSVPLISSIIEEKESGVKELMKIMGVKEWLLWISYIVNGFVISCVSFAVVTFFLQHDFNGAHSAVIRYANPVFLWIYIMLYCLANITFSFIFCAIFHNASVATAVSVLATYLISYACKHIAQLQSLYLIKLSCLFPVGALYQGFAKIAYFELNEIKFSWTSLSSLGNNEAGVSLGFAFLMLLFDTCLYLFLTYYITAINPGKFGSKKSPFFLFKLQRSASAFNDSSIQETYVEEDERKNFFEQAPSSLRTSVRIKELHKKFGSMFAVKNVNLDVYEGEITALLGHNGAGKTTTMAILTGMMKPTAGSIIYKNEIDILQEMDKFRDDLGVCTQEDRLFPYLTALQHLIFFGMLKGSAKKVVEREAKKYLKLMEMESKMNSLAATLSGGMKRKLCLSISLMGDAKTLILDEPTSGLDVESRRKIWDLLLEMREHRTIILTTHHMEEADALGDRIAIMNQGSIVCHGTPMFLKRAYDTGYQLTVSKLQNFDRDEITRIVTTAVPNSKNDEETEVEIVYKLSLTETNRFSDLFRALEKHKQVLGIKTISVSCTTMEQVFLKVGDGSIYDRDGGAREKSILVTDGNPSICVTREHLMERKKSGLRLMFQQFEALLTKKFLYTVQDKTNLFFRIILPTLILVLLLRGSLSSEEDDFSPLTLSLKMYSNSKVMFRADSSDMKFRNRFVDFVETSGSQILEVKTTDIIEELLRYGRENIGSFRNDLVVGAEVNASGRLMVYNTLALHSLPVAISAYSNVFLQSTANDNSQNIITINHPIETPAENDEAQVMIINAMICWFFSLGFYTVDLINYFATFLTMERIDGFKHIQFLSNLSPFVYWMGTIIFDFTLFWLVMMSRMGLLKMFNDAFDFLSFDEHLAVLLLVMFVYGVSGLLFLYVLNCLLKGSKEGSYGIFFVFNVACSIFICIYFFLKKFTFGRDIGFWWNVSLGISGFFIHIVPSFGYSLIFMKFLSIWQKNSQCSLLPSSLKHECEETLKKLPYLEMASETNPDGLLNDLLYLIANIILYACILAIIELDYLNKLYNYIISSIVGHVTGESSTLDPDVRQERDLVRTWSIFANSSNAVLLCQGLKKHFMKRCSPFTAVDDLNFGVKAGECFGLLGVNGAGKSTSFKMLTGDLLPTEGDASINNIKISKKKIEYLSNAGYCPQTNCFIGELKGREMLNLIALLRGTDKAQMKNLVDKWISVAGLENYQNMKCQNYSGGNKRKLCIAMSLIGDPSVIFLDEPTTGVDPVSKHKLYNIMEQCKANGQTVILSSHSMEECENLCDRLTIMSKGQMKCIGTAQHLKQRFAQGFSILIKILESPNSEQQITTLKENMRQFFKPEFCLLKDEHKGLLYYQVRDVTLLWSQLFEKMEQIKSEHRIVEDYTISDTSLEEVFLSFAKQT